MRPELVLPARAELGEGPCWEPERAELHWVDILGQSVHSFDPRTGLDRAMTLGRPVSIVVPMQAGGLLVGLDDGIAQLDVATHALEPIAACEAHLLTNRLNDGKCDAAGRLWFGSMAYSAEEGAGAFYRLEADGDLKRVLAGVTISNGVGWSPDSRLMYYIDTGLRRVDVFDFDLDRGSISGRRPLIDMSRSDEDEFPDGLAVDAEGCIWVAIWGGAEVRRYGPGGALEQVVNVPTSQVTSCAFGGDDLRALYITTASYGLDEDGFAGGLYCTATDVPGAPVAPFGRPTGQRLLTDGRTSSDDR
jgi:sugar lactone lactonase YvrE